MSEVVFTNEMDEEMTLNMGPHHPSTHGVLRFIIQSDGEIIRKATPDVGYLHRSIEKIGERCTYPGYMPYTNRVDYVAAMFANECWATACEKLMDIQVPPRAQYLRVISCELNRIASHMIAVGAMAMDIGATTPFMWALREREYINDFIEELCGARLTYNYHRIGGVSFDMPKGWADKVKTWVDKFVPLMSEFDRLITVNDIYIKRLANVAVITGAEAKDWGLVGPNLRGSGVKWDLRKDDAYSVYPELEFDVPVGRGQFGTVGRLLGPLLRPRRGVQGVGQDPPAGAGQDRRAPRRRHRRQAPQEAQARGRGLRARRERPGRHGLLRHRQGRRRALPRALPHRELQRHGDHRGQEPGALSRQSGGAHRQLQRGRSRGINR